MKSVRFVVVCAAVMLFMMFVAACGSREDYSELVRINEQLQEEVNRLLAVISAVHYQNEYPMFNRDIQSLLNDANISEPGSLQVEWEPGAEQVGWQNLASASAGMEYILWRGSWHSLGLIEHYVNLLVQHGWELVTMFQAGHAVYGGGIVVVMRR